MTTESDTRLIARLTAERDRLVLDLGAIADLTHADRPYDWRVAQIEAIARPPITKDVPR